MLRMVLILLALVVLVVAVLVWLGAINITQTQQGQMPEFNATVNPVELKIESRNVAVPVPTIQQVDQANQAQPAQ